MINFFKRFAILIPGITVSYFAAYKLYPVIGRRLPTAIAILFTYVVTAYVLIPAAIRLMHTFVTFNHLPVYATTPDGFASDPVNIGLVGTKEQVTKAMNEAGWYLADPKTPFSLFRMMLGMVFSFTYNHAPFSSLYLFGRAQDLGFQKPIGSNPRKRHHVRFWAANFTYSPKYQEDIFFWSKKLEPVDPDKILWVGAASLDSGFGLIRHTAQLTHRIKPDTNSERELIFKDLKQKGFVKSSKTARLVKAYSLRNRVWRGSLKSDGKIVIIELK